LADDDDGVGTQSRIDFRRFAEEARRSGRSMHRSAAAAADNAVTRIVAAARIVNNSAKDKGDIAIDRAVSTGILERKANSQIFEAASAEIQKCSHKTTAAGR